MQNKGFFQVSTISRLFIFIIVLACLSGFSKQEKERRVVFFGDSITAGLGVEPEQAYPALIQQKIDSLGWNFNVVNAGLSGETSSGGLSRIDWVLQKPVTIFVLELGGNDGLRGIDLSLTEENLQKIINKVRNKYPEAKIILAGMEVPPNLGQKYTEQFKEMYPVLAQKNNVALIPFLLQNVGGIRSLNQQDGIHPTAKGHIIVAENVWKVLKPILEKVRKDDHNGT